MKMKKVIIPALVVAALATTNVIASACFSPKTEPVKPDISTHGIIKPAEDSKVTPVKPEPTEDSKPDKPTIVKPQGPKEEISAKETETGFNANTLVSIENDSYEAAWEDIVETVLLCSGTKSKTISAEVLRGFMDSTKISALKPFSAMLTDDAVVTITSNGSVVTLTAEIPSIKSAFSAFDKACTMTFTADCSDVYEKIVGCKLTFTVDDQVLSAKELVAEIAAAYVAANEEIPSELSELKQIFSECGISASVHAKDLNDLFKQMNKCKPAAKKLLPPNANPLISGKNSVWAFLNSCLFSDSLSLNTKSFEKFCKDMKDITISAENNSAVVTAALKDEESKAVLAYYQENPDALLALADDAAANGLADLTGLCNYAEGTELSKTAKYAVITMPLSLFDGQTAEFSLNVYRTYEFKAAHKKIDTPAKKNAETTVSEEETAIVTEEISETETVTEETQVTTATETVSEIETEIVEEITEEEA